MDHIGKLNTVSLQFDVAVTDKDIDKFGLPKDFLKRYIQTPEIEVQRKKQLEDGMFKVIDNRIEIDLTAAVNYYAPVYCKGIANLLIQILQNNEIDTRHHRIEMAIKFVQDIPYAIPDEFEGKKYTGGALCPPELLIRGYGDCDSKTMLFVGILSYMINPNDIIFVGVTNHMLAAVKNDEVPGGVYFKNGDDRYYLAETAGPGRQAFGEPGNDYKKGAHAEQFVFAHKIDIPPTLNIENLSITDNKYYYIKIENTCRSKSEFIIRYLDVKGNWVFSGFKNLEGNSVSEVFTTQEPVFFIYGYSGNIFWQGSNSFSLNGKDYMFNKVNIPAGQTSEYTMRLRCN